LGAGGGMVGLGRRIKVPLICLAARVAMNDAEVPCSRFGGENGSDLEVMVGGAVSVERYRIGEFWNVIVSELIYAGTGYVSSNDTLEGLSCSRIVRTYVDIAQIGSLVNTSETKTVALVHLGVNKSPP